VLAPREVLEIAQRTRELLLQHPSVRAATLAGSRKRGSTTALSDLDIEVEVGDFVAFKRDLPQVVEVLEPLGKMWDPFGDHWTYMLMLSGPLKVDIIIDMPHEDAAPWKVSVASLSQIDHHFWDWILWLGSKQLHSQREFVQNELEKMHKHLLAPLGVSSFPRDLPQAVHSYMEARTRTERALGLEIDRRMGIEVSVALRQAGIL
jgi:predicted nucleotidyltransferase